MPNVSIQTAMNEMEQELVTKLNTMKETDVLADGYDDAEKAAKLSFAKLLKYYEYFRSSEKGFAAELSEDKKKQLDNEAEEIAKSKTMSHFLNATTVDKVRNVLVDEKTNLRRRIGEFVIAQEPDGTIRFATNQQRQQEEQNRATLLTGFLEQTTDRSFTGKLKSWFVGNSREYKNAIKALKNYGKTGNNKEDTIKKIQAYLDIRKSKVRDHQYGRDRFQGFMESLQTLMEPQDFKQYCDSVNEARKTFDNEYDPRHVQPGQFAPTNNSRSVLGALLDQQAREQAAAKAQWERQQHEKDLQESRERQKLEEQKKYDQAMALSKVTEAYFKDKGIDVKLGGTEKDSGPKNVKTNQSKTNQGPERDL